MREKTWNLTQDNKADWNISGHAHTSTPMVIPPSSSGFLDYPTLNSYNNEKTQKKTKKKRNNWATTNNLHPTLCTACCCICSLVYNIKFCDSDFCEVFTGMRVLFRDKKNHVFRIYTTNAFQRSFTEGQIIPYTEYYSTVRLFIKSINADFITCYLMLYEYSKWAASEWQQLECWIKNHRPYLFTREALEY